MVTSPERPPFVPRVRRPRRAPARPPDPGGCGGRSTPHYDQRRRPRRQGSRARRHLWRARCRAAGLRRTARPVVGTPGPTVTADDRSLFVVEAPDSVVRRFTYFCERGGVQFRARPVLGGPFPARGYGEADDATVTTPLLLRVERGRGTRLQSDVDQAPCALRRPPGCEGWRLDPDPCGRLAHLSRGGLLGRPRQTIRPSMGEQLWATVTAGTRWPSAPGHPTDEGSRMVARLAAPGLFKRLDRQSCVAAAPHGDYGH